ncbi:ABC transporter ATP-binding protein [Roseomonas stagni]|uniref:ABC transporter ATP-binding protein n=1 Tax=Falsiroseomonas algicola TaxID=2716930 RepID=A0A6M1LFB0_9PROT|nr:ABC transporter ATP-binding protein [Falsiroseomonas algicola]NGM18832.1 ABC transporter ATP-binding protein [Falsiroseomonas algicola]
MTAPLLAVRGLRAVFPTRRGLLRAVDGVDFDIAAGEVLALLGESGSGKSVTSLALMGLLPPSARVEGEVRFQGRDLRAMDPASLRSLRGDALAMVFQEPMASLNPVLSVGRQVAEALVAHGRADRRAAKARAIELFGEVGLSDPARRYDAYPHELSGGMCQRVMIAMAIACDPALLIADEPTTALDVTIQKQILALIDDLRRRRGTAVLLITHDLGVVAENADRVAVMYAGRIVETAPVSALFAAPLHPYTRGLLDSMPDLDDEEAVLHAIPGQVPDLAALPSGCAFAARCPRSSDRCRAEAPPLVDHAPGRAARCWHPLA